MDKAEQADNIRHLIDVVSSAHDQNFHIVRETWVTTLEHRFVDQIVRRSWEVATPYKTIYGSTEPIMGMIESLMETPPRFPGGIDWDVHRVLLEEGSIDYIIHGLIDDDQAVKDEFSHGWRNSMMVLMFWLHTQGQLQSTLERLVTLYEQHLVGTESDTPQVLRLTLSMHVMASLYSAIHAVMAITDDAPLEWKEPFLVQHLYEELENLESLHTARTVQESAARWTAAKARQRASSQDTPFPFL